MLLIRTSLLRGDAFAPMVVALQLDRALDDGKWNTGNFRTGTVCAGQDENTAVANAVLKLN